MFTWSAEKGDRTPGGKRRRKGLTVLCTLVGSNGARRGAEVASTAFFKLERGLRERSSSIFTFRVFSARCTPST